MKFWNSYAEEDLLVDMTQCQKCYKWIPTGNMELHLLFHQKHLPEFSQDDRSLPSFVMETIPCDACQVLVPKGNWEIHKAHVCRGRQNQAALENEPSLLVVDTQSSCEIIECELCGNLVPIHNLELHETRACPAARPLTTPQRGTPTEEARTGLAVEGSFEDWECPRCTFQNSEMKDSESVWKCAMCQYSLSDRLEEEGPTTKNAQSEQKSSDFWQNFVETWLPQEYHQLLPESLAPKQSKNRNNKKKPRRQKAKQKRRTKAGQTPTPCEVRRGRNHHLSLLERERQQYLQLLKTTRQEASRLQNHGGLAEIETIDTKTDNDGDHEGVSTGNESSNNASVHPAAPHQQNLLSHPDPSQLELLQATEQLCLYHLEHLRRTRLAQELILDIELLGTTCWTCINLHPKYMLTT